MSTPSKINRRAARRGSTGQMVGFSLTMAAVADTNSERQLPVRCGGGEPSPITRKDNKNKEAIQALRTTEGAKRRQRRRQTRRGSIGRDSSTTSVATDTTPTSNKPRRAVRRGSMGQSSESGVGGDLVSPATRRPRRLSASHRSSSGSPEQQQGGVERHRRRVSERPRNVVKQPLNIKKDAFGCDPLDVDPNGDFGFALHGFLLDVPFPEEEEAAKVSKKTTKKRTTSGATRNRKLVSHKEPLRIRRESVPLGMQF